MQEGGSEAMQCWVELQGICAWLFVVIAGWDSRKQRIHAECDDTSNSQKKERKERKELKGDGPNTAARWGHT